jgi:hypothetical protein
MRLLKVRALCERSGVSFEEVLPLLSADLQEQIKG